MKACFTNEPGGPLDPPDWKYEKPLNDCWNVQTWTGYMVNHGYWTAGDPAEDGGDVWLNTAANGSFECYSKKTVDRVNCNDHSQVTTPNWRMFPPFVRTVTKACPSTPTPTPTPRASPTPGPTPTPNADGTHCAPLSHIGVSFLAQHPAPNGPLGYRWVFSATNKAVKPYCPEQRNECEQQGYEGDPVSDYDHVVWRFDMRFQCQAPYKPLWNQQEPHTGDHWENTDVRQENEWNANLKPAVRGLHRVRVCDPRAPGPEFGENGGNCRITEKMAN